MFLSRHFKTEYVYNQDKWITLLLFGCVALILLLTTTMVAIELMEYYERLELTRETITNQALEMPPDDSDDYTTRSE